MENWLSKRVANTPDRIAVYYQNQSWTFAEIQTKILFFASQIQAEINSEKRIGLVLYNNLAGYLAIMAAQQLGLELVLLNRRLSAVELNDQIKDAGLQLVLTDGGYQEDLAVHKQLNFKDLPTTGLAEVEPVAEFPNDDTTSIMYTSGTTSRPKGVCQTFGNHFYSAMSSALNLGLSADDCWLVAVPIFHISGFSILMRHLIYGAAVVLEERFDAQLINQRLVDLPVTHMSVVPVMLQDMLADLQPGQHYNKHFRAMLVGGGPSKENTLREAQAHGVPVVQCYGMTETSSQVVALDPEYALDKIGSVGKPLFSVELRLGKPGSAQQQAGDVWIKTPNLTKGYLNQPHLLAEKMQAGWFQTGDYGHFDEEGFLYIDGRSGDMISSGGENIFPDEVENALADQLVRQDFAVVGQADEHWGAVPALVLTEPVDLAALLAVGRQRLAHYKLPKHFYLTASLPKTASGKIKRSAIAQNLANYKELS
ncbi:o-succinylbenzoate--CoA ligase [Eupransor demetentiae]|uniref:2-succinylbenzoate--CoA ligase n=1 Tax=Eupransor demetentiae TaxID=3109584 RepID=A0ABM9N6R9_9LACO|nr:O-succinylbenzoic acid-CoA ligase MenE or related acyl-CoA synthetase (AMP-forming) (MenE/FadK) [Lactobacillaceae bacterium LMG 33000]